MSIIKTHNEIAALCRDALFERIGKVSIVPWDKIIYTFSEGMSGTELDNKRIENTFLACVRKDERFQALLTPQERRKIEQKA